MTWHTPEQDPDQPRDPGFTLIELLVVIIIVAILAGVGIPLYMNQRVRGVDGGLISDLKNLSTAVETYTAEYHAQSYFGTSPTPTDQSVSDALGTTSAVNFRPSPSNVVQIKGSPVAGYCLRARNDRGSMGVDQRFFFFDSQAGGLVDGAPAASVTGGACGVAGTWYTVS